MSPSSQRYSSRSEREQRGAAADLLCQGAVASGELFEIVHRLPVEIAPTAELAPVGQELEAVVGD